MGSLSKLTVSVYEIINMTTSTFQTEFDIDEPLLDLDSCAPTKNAVLAKRRRIARFVGPFIGFGFVAFLIWIVLVAVISSRGNHTVTDKKQLQGTMNVTNSNNTASTNTIPTQKTSTSTDTDTTLVNAAVPLSEELQPTPSVTKTVSSSAKSSQTDANATIPVTGSNTDQGSIKPSTNSPAKIVESGALESNTTLPSSSASVLKPSTTPSKSSAINGAINQEVAKN